MSRLEYRTLTNSKPRDKQKIFFCCHPDDFDMYFNDICKDIFTVCKDCAVFYEAEPQKPLSPSERELLLSQLGDMQLIVVAATEKLLSTKCRARDLELPFARGLVEGSGGYRNIAVLPIILKDKYPDIVTTFNRSDNVIRDLQFIDKLQRGEAAETAVSYIENLRRRIEGVLVGEELKKAIRSHFRAKIFMSYRKKDRAHVQELMKQIHRIDFCRDVATWYDEFLSPGEVWEEELDRNIRDCDLVAVSMTPLTLETSDSYSRENKKGNYVTNEEFDKAITYGKPVIPVETVRLVGKEIEKIRELFNRPAINGTIDELLVPKDDGNALRTALLRELINTPGRKELLMPDDRPEHLYYIGLAYKNNIDAEIDPEKCVDLLEKAGKKGYSEAYYTLGKMFETGDTVPVDIDRAIKYYTDYIAGYKADFGTSKNGDLHFVEAYDSIGMIYQSRGQISKALECYKELNELLRDMKSCFGSFQQLNLPASYDRLAKLYQKQGNMDAANEYISKAIAVRKNPPRIKNIATEADATDESPQEYNDYHFRLVYAVILHTQGEMLLHNGDTMGSIQSYKKANELFTDLTRKNDDEETMLMLAKSYLGLGGALIEARNNSAKEQLERAHEILDNLSNDTYNLEIRRQCICSEFSYGELYRKLYPLDYSNKAKAHYEAALAELLELMELDSGSENKNLLALLYERLGIINTKLGNRTEARKYYEKHLDVSAELSENNEDTEYQRGLSIANENLAKSYAESGEFYKALDYYSKSMAITKKLAAKNAGDMQAKRDLSVGYYGMSELYERIGDYEKALEYTVKDYITTQDIAAGSNGISPQLADDLATSFYRIGCLCPDVRKDCFARACHIWSNALRITGATEFRGKLELLRNTGRTNDMQHCVRPGFCKNLTELISRYAGDTRIHEEFLSTPVDVSERGCTNKLLAVFVLFVIFCIVTYFGYTDRIMDWIKSLL